MLKSVLCVSALLGVVAIPSAGCSDDVIDMVDVPEEPEEEFPPGPAVVRLIPSRPVYDVGSRVEVQVVIDNASNVGAIPFKLRYDSQVLAFVPPAVEGPFMGSDGADTVFLASDVPGAAEVAVGLSRLSRVGIGGSGTLAVFEFDAVAIGNCGFAFASASVKDPEGRNLPAAFYPVPVSVEP